MRVSDQMLKCVVFIGSMKSGDFLPRATGFLVSYEHKARRFNALVTAEHVVANLKAEGGDLYVRLMMGNGESGVAAVPYDQWHFYPDETKLSDVAACPIPIMFQSEVTKEMVAIDALTIPLNGNKATVATQDIITEKDLGVGEEVCIVGLFKHHHGKEINRKRCFSTHAAAS